MKVNLQEVQQLKAKFNAMLLDESVLTYSDKQAMQEVFNIEHYLLSNAKYDASFQIGMLKELVKDCSTQIAEHLKPFLASL
ncbi:hypothetical protein [Pedobacter sp.]